MDTVLDEIVATDNEGLDSGWIDGNKLPSSGGRGGVVQPNRRRE